VGPPSKSHVATLSRDKNATQVFPTSLCWLGEQGGDPGVLHIWEGVIAGQVLGYTHLRQQEWNYL
jgi:hypothetical protein